MRAAILHGPEDLRVEEVPEPATEVVVEVHAATTCGTDVKMWRHGHPALPPYPCSFGHETAGVRTDDGARVLVSDSVACGRCEPCRAGRPQICRDPAWLLGGFAERIAAPAEALHAIPDGLPFAAAAMAEPTVMLVVELAVALVPMLIACVTAPLVLPMAIVPVVPLVPRLIPPALLLLMLSAVFEPPVETVSALLVVSAAAEI